jgi:hypothetical protein
MTWPRVGTDRSHGLSCSKGAVEGGSSGVVAGGGAVTRAMIVTITRVADFDQPLKTFSTTGVEKRREHERKGSYVFGSR